MLICVNKQTTNKHQKFVSLKALNYNLDRHTGNKASQGRLDF